jgi:type III secretion system FlhB-like substrate exporter
MADHRPFPPSPRRRALARQAGLHTASPLVTGAVAATAAVLAASTTAAGTADPSAALGAATAPAAAGAEALPAAGAAAFHAAPGAAALPGALSIGELVLTVASFALPILGAAAIAALVAHLAQTRAPWLPRRRIRGAPALEAGATPRVRRSGGELAAATVIAAVAFGWLWWMAPRLAALAGIGPIAAPATAGSPHAAQLAGSPLLAGAAALLVSLAVALVVAWLALGVVDALVRHAALRRALAMTSTEKREDDRLAGADPRWRARRAAVQRGPRLAEAVAGASLLVLGDDAAVAIAWDPLRRPIPVRTATGRGPRARQLLGLARRHRIAVHRDPALAAALVDGDGPIPEPQWPRLAEVIAATRGRATAGDTLAHDPG